jgi:hypothetical protein
MCICFERLVQATKGNQVCRMVTSTYVCVCVCVCVCEYTCVCEMIDKISIFYQP